MGAEISLTMLAYDVTRVINILGVKKLMAEVITDDLFIGSEVIVTAVRL